MKRISSFTAKYNKKIQRNVCSKDQGPKPCFTAIIFRALDSSIAECKERSLYPFPWDNFVFSKNILCLVILTVESSRDMESQTGNRGFRKSLHWNASTATMFLRAQSQSDGAVRPSFISMSSQFHSSRLGCIIQVIIDLLFIFWVNVIRANKLLCGPVEGQ